MMTIARKLSPRAEYRMRQARRVESSATLAAKFPNLKSLTALLHHFDPSGLVKTGEMRYKVNVLHAKSVLRLDCPCGECAGGDYDLTVALATAINSQRAIAEGELQCRGERTRPRGEKLHCRNILRYKLSLRYV